MFQHPGRPLISAILYLFGDVGHHDPPRLQGVDVTKELEAAMSGNATSPSPLAVGNDTVPLWLIENAYQDDHNASDLANDSLWTKGEPALEPIGNVADLKPILASCADSVADGDVHCLANDCASTRDRFHGNVGDVIKVWCPAHCGSAQGDVYGPGDGTASEEQCSGFRVGAKAIFLDASAICRSAVAMRALGQETAGIVVIRLVEPVPSYPSCHNMPHKTPGMPYRSLNGHIGSNGIYSKNVTWRDWDLAEDRVLVAEFGGPERCCLDTQPCPLGDAYNGSSHYCEWHGGSGGSSNVSMSERIKNEITFMGDTPQPPPAILSPQFNLSVCVCTASVALHLLHCIRCFASL